MLGGCLIVLRRCGDLDSRICSWEVLGPEAFGLYSAAHEEGMAVQSVLSVVHMPLAGFNVGVSA